ncbi:MAG: response regulator receiver protein [Verrucomicrobiales bacterium]|nr:response regulator receiver protein [Verrucomicrobiales bacterium]
MPLRDGCSVLEHIKDNPAWALIPTVVLSASADLDDIKRAYLRKPQGFEELRAMLDLFYQYWAQCEVPEVLETGERAETHCAGKLGQRYAS